MARQPARVRAVFPTTGANVWVLDGRSASVPTITLEHDYEDLKPAPGWHVLLADAAWEITGVAGPVLTITQLGAPANG